MPGQQRQMAADFHLKSLGPGVDDDGLDQVAEGGSGLAACDAAGVKPAMQRLDLFAVAGDGAGMQRDDLSAVRRGKASCQLPLFFFKRAQLRTQCSTIGIVAQDGTNNDRAEARLRGALDVLTECGPAPIPGHVARRDRTGGGARRPRLHRALSEKVSLRQLLSG